jgi:hypothetical protein
MYMPVNNLDEFTLLLEEMDVDALFTQEAKKELLSSIEFVLNKTSSLPEDILSSFREAIINSDFETGQTKALLQVSRCTEAHVMKDMIRARLLFTMPLLRSLSENGCKPGVRISMSGGNSIVYTLSVPSRMIRILPYIVPCYEVYDLIMRLRTKHMGISDSPFLQFFDSLDETKTTFESQLFSEDGEPIVKEIQRVLHFEGTENVLGKYLAKYILDCKFEEFKALVLADLSKLPPQSEESIEPTAFRLT